MKDMSPMTTIKMHTRLYSASQLEGKLLLMEGGMPGSLSILGLRAEFGL